MIKEIEKREEVLTKEFFISYFNDFRLEFNSLKSEFYDFKTEVKNEFEGIHNDITNIRREIKEQGDDFQRYVGIVSENFQDKLSMVAEMVAQNSVDITEMKEDINYIKSDIHDIRYDLRGITRLEIARA